MDVNDRLIRLQQEPLSVDAALAAVASPDCGATVVFIGTVRRDPDARALDALQYETYAAMAERRLEALAADIRARVAGARIAIVHRTGIVPLGEASVVIAVSTPHRAEAFEACREAIERLKRDIPIWKL